MATTKTQIKKLIAEGWIMIDPSCNQMRKEIEKDNIYSFREDRIINPKTKEKRVFKKTLEYNKLSWEQIISACKTFGYLATDIDKWMTEGEEIPLMLECVFELM
jgi:hypothetical protein